MRKRKEDPVTVTVDGIRFNIHDLEDGKTYSVVFKDTRYLIKKKGKKVIIYRLR